MKFYYLLLFSIFTLFIFQSCEKTKEDVLNDPDFLNNGDVVFRLGDSSVSNAVMVADEEADYSHVGIVVSVDDKKMIVHACPPDIESVDTANQVRIDTPKAFFDSKCAVNGAVYRHENYDVAEAAANYAYDLYLRHVPFDYNFDTNDTTSMYCSELVEFAYLKSGESLLKEKGHVVDIPGVYIENCILVSDIQKSEKLNKVIAF